MSSRAGRRLTLGVQRLDARQLLAADLGLQVCLPEDMSSAIAAESHDHDSGLRYDREGYAYYHDPLPPGIDTSGTDTSGTNTSGTDAETEGKQDAADGRDGKSGEDGYQKFDLTVPAYSSLPSAAKKIYLDFDGQSVTNSVWNNKSYGGLPSTGPEILAQAYSTDGDVTTFNSTELTRIREIWARVAEDFRPFDVDVTTVEPPAQLFTQGSQAIRVVISTDVNQVTGEQWYPNAGGVAYLNSWTYQSDTPVWVFENRLGNGNEKYVAEAASHEVGHAFNLRHDGVTGGSAYYQGHGSGETGWAPIMGVGYYQPLVQWSSGEYDGANQTESDLSKIAGYVPYRPDDHGNDVSAATELSVGAAGEVSASGIITQRDDLDAFTFFTRAGTVALTVTPFELSDGKANLDVGLTLLDDQGAEVDVASPLDDLDAMLSVDLLDGFYTLVVDGVGRVATTGHPGYSDYGSLGYFDLSGTVQPNYAPETGDDVAGTLVDTPITVDVLANDTDANGDTLTLSDVSVPANGAAVIVGSQIEYTPDPGFVGTDVFTYDVEDGFGGTAQGTVEIDVVTAPVITSVQVDDGSGQRSMLREMRVVFDREVSVGAGAFEVQRRGTGGGVVLTDFTTEVVGGVTVATITFDTSSEFVEASGSLGDGNYQLMVLGAAVTDQYGFQLDGDGDDQVGGDYLLGDEEADAFFRFFGDLDGNRTVEFGDLVQFLAAYESPGDYRAPLDYNADDAINFSDLVQVLSRYELTLAFE